MGAVQPRCKLPSHESVVGGRLDDVINFEDHFAHLKSDTAGRIQSPSGMTTLSNDPHLDTGHTIALCACVSNCNMAARDGLLHDKQSSTMSLLASMVATH
jgi:hypothetical protein